jgi:hypothetical protein
MADARFYGVPNEQDKINVFKEDASMKIMDILVKTARALTVFSLASAFVCSAAPRASAALSADDFIPPVQARTPEEKRELLAVKDEASVKTEFDPVLQTEVTTSPSLQDSINEKINPPRQGCEPVREPGGGYAFVATGQGNYNPGHENVVMSRIEQRNAYVAAFMDAKSQMVKFLEGVSVSAFQSLDTKTGTIDTGTEGLRNIEIDQSESNTESARKVLKRYVTYAVRDDGKGKVFVTIVSTSRTRSKFDRRGSEGISAASLNEGINILLTEIGSGLIPPVGGKIIDVPGSGEVAFVGFGSHIVRKDPEADVQAELDLQAERIAGMRANAGLAGIILGDDTLYQGASDDEATKLKKDYDLMAQSDPTTQDSGEDIKKYDERKKEIRNVVTENLNIQSLVQGKLPPGVTSRTYIDDDGYFAYGISVYIPSLSAAVMDAAKEMDEADLPDTGEKSNSAPETPKKRDQQPLEMKKGPSGIVEQDL